MVRSPNAREPEKQVIPLSRYAPFTGLSVYGRKMRDLLRTRRYEALRSVLKQARSKLGLSQAEVASRIGRPQTYISDIETGVRRIDIIEFLRLAEVLEIDPAKTIASISRVRDRL